MTLRWGDGPAKPEAEFRPNRQRHFQVPPSTNMRHPHVGQPHAREPAGPNEPAAPGQSGDKPLYELVVRLLDPKVRDDALFHLSKKREEFPDLAPILWHSVGTIACLLQEIVNVYPRLRMPSDLTAPASNRCCNALALLQCVASHSETRAHFLNAQIPLFLYPFLNTTHKHRPFEYLRLTSLGVIGALVKVDDSAVIKFLLQTEIIPLCLRIMESGSELSKTVATFIVQKILLDDQGLTYICATAERFYTVSSVFSNMVIALETEPSVRLLKHIVRCYLRLTDNSRARDALRDCLPQSLRQGSGVFDQVLEKEETTRTWLLKLGRFAPPYDPS